MTSANNNHEKRGIRIAVADDEMELRDYWQEILPRLGYNLVGIVSSGEELVELCQQSRPDVIITDVCFDGLSGVEAIAVIRRDLTVSVVFVTGRLHEDAAVEQGEGVVVLAKPFSIEQLRAAVAVALWQTKEQTGSP